MTSLSMTSNIPQPDDFYAGLLALHEGLSLEESAKVSAKLILILANHIGNMDVLAQALQAAAPSQLPTRA